MKYFRKIWLIVLMLCIIAALCACKGEKTSAIIPSEKKEYSELIIGQWTWVEQRTSWGDNETYQRGDETTAFLPDGTCVDRELVKWWLNGEKLMLLTDDDNYVEVKIITLDEKSLIFKRDLEDGESVTLYCERMD